VRFCAVTVTTPRVVVFCFAVDVVSGGVDCPVSCATAGAAMARQMAAASGNRINVARLAFMACLELLACMRFPLIR
jgi:hypothetical protein